MKKIYKTPTTYIVKTQIQHQLCSTSEVGTGDYNGGSIESRRGGSFWDDEEE